MEEIIFNPIKDKNPRGTLKKGETITFTFRIKQDLEIDKIILVLRHEASNYTHYLKLELSEFEINYNVYKTSVELDVSGLYWYHFEIYQDEDIVKVNKGNDYKGVLGENEEFPLTVIDKEIPFIKEGLGGIIYQIFVDRFNKTCEPDVRPGFVYRDDWGGVITKNTTDRAALNYEVFGGTLDGVTEKLDYLKDLGVSIIYLCPVFLAPSNHKYDTSDYMQVDPMFGGQEALEKLIKEAKKRNMGVILDGVFNHIGSDSIYFNKYNNFPTIGAYNSKDSKYYDWFKFYDWPDGYDCWWGIDTLPDVNQENKELQEYIANVLKHYIDMGILGYRLDVVDEIGHNYLTKICDSIRENKKDALIIGEVWEDASTKIAYGRRRGYFLGHELNSVMNYPLREALLNFIIHNNANHFYYVYQMIEDNYPEFVKHNLMNLIDSHDTRRILSVLEEDNHVLEKLKIITALQYGFYGNPSIFYGDEVGIREDPPDFSRKCFPWGNENQEILEWYKFLGELRKREVFKSGKMDALKAEDGIIIFKRYIEGEEILFAASVSNEVFTYLLYDSYTSLIDGTKSTKVRIKPYQIHILKKD